MEDQIYLEEYYKELINECLKYDIKTGMIYLESDLLSKLNLENDKLFRSILELYNIKTLPKPDANSKPRIKSMMEEIKEEKTII